MVPGRTAVAMQNRLNNHVVHYLRNNRYRGIREEDLREAERRNNDGQGMVTIMSEIFTWNSPTWIPGLGLPRYFSEDRSANPEALEFVRYWSRQRLYCTLDCTLAR